MSKVIVITAAVVVAGLIFFAVFVIQL